MRESKARRARKMIRFIAKEMSRGTQAGKNEDARQEGIEFAKRALAGTGLTPSQLRRCARVAGRKEARHG